MSNPPEVRRVDPSEIALMLYDAAKKHGYTLVEANQMWEADELWEPDLRDLWLIYGFVVEGNAAADYQTSIVVSQMMAPPGFMDSMRARIAELDDRYPPSEVEP